MNAQPSSSPGSSKTDHHEKDSSPASPASSTAPNDESNRSTPVLLILGMAGSGKSTLTAALQTHFTSPYLLNLDPAVLNPPFSPHIDIRDTISYAKVMRDYQLGPNGAILTSLNLFSTRFDQVLDLLSHRSPQISEIVVDTPGQIETFTWSASGEIIANALAGQHPTVVVYVVDTVRSGKPLTFVSNMLHACSIMYKTRLPMVLVFTKSDACADEEGGDEEKEEGEGDEEGDKESGKANGSQVNGSQANGTEVEDVLKPMNEERPRGSVVRGWLRDFEAFESAIGEEMGFRGTLARSMALALSEFYEEVRSVAVSSITGQGFEELDEKIKEAVEEFEKEYRPVLEKQKKEKEEKEKKRVEEEMKKLKRDREEERRIKRAETGIDPVEDKEEYDKFLKDVERLNAEPGTAGGKGSQ